MEAGRTRRRGRAGGAEWVVCMHTRVCIACALTVDCAVRVWRHSAHSVRRAVGYGAVRCGVRGARCGAVRCGVVQCTHTHARCGVVRCGVVQCGAVWCGVIAVYSAVRCDAVRCGAMMRCGAVRCGECRVVVCRGVECGAVRVVVCHACCVCVPSMPSIYGVCAAVRTCRAVRMCVPCECMCVPLRVRRRHRQVCECRVHMPRVPPRVPCVSCACRAVSCCEMKGSLGRTYQDENHGDSLLQALHCHSSDE